MYDRLSKADFWNLPTRAGVVDAVDSSLWILEAVQNGRYRQYAEAALYRLENPEEIR